MIDVFKLHDYLGKLKKKKRSFTTKQPTNQENIYWSDTSIYLLNPRKVINLLAKNSWSTFSDFFVLDCCLTKVKEPSLLLAK